MNLRDKCVVGYWTLKGDRMKVQKISLVPILNILMPD
jgi:hypothetical protein